MDAQVSSDKITQIVNGYQTRSNYPRNEYGNGLRTVAAMIKGEMPTRVYYVSLGGFDTHANQAGRHDNLMQQFAQGVEAFWNDIKEQKNEQRVTMMCFSEFASCSGMNMECDLCFCAQLSGSFPVPKGHPPLSRPHYDWRNARQRRGNRTGD